MDFENLIFTKLTVYSFSSIQIFNFVICYNIALRLFRGKFSFYVFFITSSEKCNVVNYKKAHVILINSCN